MGLCLSKKDVLIQRPQRDQLLGHLNLHRAGILVPDSPSASVVSTEISSIAATERALLRNCGSGGAMRSSSVSNMAECGSVREWRFARNSSASSARNGNIGRFANESESEADDLASSSAAAPRSSNFSYLSSPMIEGLDAAYGLDNIARSYQRARERFELDVAGALNPLDEDEEHDCYEEEELEDEEELEEDEGIASEYSTSSSSFAIKKKSQARSLHVFGDVFGETSARIGKLAMPAMPTIRIISGDQERASAMSAKREISVFGADHYFGARNSTSQQQQQQQPKEQIQPPKFEFGRSSLDFGPEIVSEQQQCQEQQQQHNVHVRSARWGFFLDTSGSDEMEGDEELSRLSTSSVRVEPIFKAAPPTVASSIAAAATAAASFMAVPPRSEIWKANFSHMNPAPAANPCEKDDDSSIAASVTTTTTTTSSSASNESSSDYSSSSINLSSNLHSYGQSHGSFRAGAHAFTISAKKAPAPARSSVSSSCDDADSSMATATATATFHRRQHYSLDFDGDDSDSSTDLFEIENLSKDFIYPMSITSSFLKDPDISYSSAKVMGSRIPSSAASQSQFQSFPASRSAVPSAPKILGPTLRANVPVSSKQRSTSGEFQPPRKSLKARRRSGGGGGSFYGSGIAAENESLSFYAR